MNVEQFRTNGKDMVDYICQYLSTIEERRVVPSVAPGYLANLMPGEAPKEPEEWREIMSDVDKLIMPGITHWQHPRFHAYFPSGNAFPSIMGEMLSSAFACIGFSWVASPAYAELEMVMCDWLAKMMQLPKSFMFSENLGGGGVIQGSASDSIFVSLLTARHKTIKEEKLKNNYNNNKITPTCELNLDAKILSRLVGYCSCLAHSCVEKNAMIAVVKIRHLEVDDCFSLRGEVLEAAIQKDKASGLIPFFVCATLGTTACCSFDNLEEIGQVCQKHDIWLHVDAAYAGSSFICPEFRHLMKGVEHVKSINFNPNKFMLINFDCSILWVKNSEDVTDSMIVNPVYLQHKHSSKAVDFRHWGVPLSRRFRSLKLWFTIRCYGVKGLQSYIRNHVNLAKQFSELVKSNKRFEIVGKQTLGLVCFRLRELNSINQCLIRAINESGLLHMTPSVVKDKYILRFCVCNEHAKIDDIHYAWSVINKFAEELMISQNGIAQWRYYLNENNNNSNQIYRNTADELVNSVLSSESIQECIKKQHNHYFSKSKNDFQNSSEPFKINAKIKENISDEQDVIDEDDIKENDNNDMINELNSYISMDVNDTNNNYNFIKSVTNISNDAEEDDNDGGKYDDDDDDDDEKLDDNEVFVCESDLGVGVSRQNTLTKLRRQTFLKMISDPTVYNHQFFKSYCLCDDVKHGSKSTVLHNNKCFNRHSPFSISGDKIRVKEFKSSIVEKED